MIGPGSEWFWTAVIGLVLAVTFFAIYRQLRLQRGQAAIAQVTAIRVEWLSKAERYKCLAALIDLEDRALAEGMPFSAYAPANWFDRLGYLVRKGHLNAEDAVTTFSDDLLFWWSICEPFIKQERTLLRLDQGLADFEYLATQMGRLWKAETGSAYKVRDTVAQQIEWYTELLQQQQDFDRGVIPARKPATTVAGG